MMKIKIAHLYYDLLNLYGEQGNILALTNAFNKQKINVTVDLLSIEDNKKFNKYDIIYIGSGSEENLLLALNDLKKDTQEIKEYIKKDKYFISTGNSKDLFGKFIQINNSKYKALNIFDYYSKQNPVRIVGESIMGFKDLPPIVGFQNRACVMQNNYNHLFSVINGYADNYKSSYEGYRENNFLATYLIGPLLIRNPHFTDYIVKDILIKKKIKFKEITDTYEYKAYQEYINNFYE